jgi:UDP-N-acetylglucosamine 2-epimerase (non-hydrolysing)
VTLHRPVNVDFRATLATLVDALIAISHRLPLIFPAHPRTRTRLEEFGLLARLRETVGIRLVDPLSYIDFMAAVLHSRLVLTDSGGVQEETTYLGIPCYTIRSTTERPITITLGTNRLIRVEDALVSVEGELKTLVGSRRGSVLPLWDGQTSKRVASDIRQLLA